MKPAPKAVCLPLCVLLFLAIQVSSLAQPPTISYQSTITGLTAPIDIINAGDGSNRLFIVEQAGTIRVWNGTTTSLFMDISALVLDGGEQGLLSMAFHPDFDGTSNRYFFVYYNNNSGDIEMSRFQTTAGNSNTGDASTQTVIMTIPHPTNNNHNGGKLNFGTDGYLYFATGDGGGANDVPNNAQNGNSLLGKMIRIDINTLTTQSFGQYTIPPTNPYVGDAAVLDEIWALGLRNPFRWSFDRATGNMWIGDVGQGLKEEINYRPAGSTGHVNYGWRCYEGSVSTPDVTDCTPVDNVFPVFDYDNPTPGAAAVTGGYVYRGTEYSTLRGYYTAVDVYSGTLYFLWPNGSGGFNSASQTGLQNFVVGFGEAENGTLYAASQATNTVYKIVATGGTILPVRLKEFSVSTAGNGNQLRWTTSYELGTSGFYVEYSIDGIQFLRTGHIPALKNPQGSHYSYHHVNPPNVQFYRLAMEEEDGRINFSSILKTNRHAKKIEVYPTRVRDGLLHLVLPEKASQLLVFSRSGAVVFQKNLGGLAGTTSVMLPGLTPGIYIVQRNGVQGMVNRKIMID